MRAPDPFEELVAATRPALSPDAARRIDARVRPRLRPRPRRTRSWLPALGVAAAILLIIGIGVAASGRSTSNGTSSSSGGSAASSAAPGRSSANGAAASAESAAPGARAVEQDTTMSLAAPPGQVDAVASAASRTASDLGGFVASSNVTAGQGAQLELRIPGPRLDAAVERLSHLGHVRTLQRSTLDITGELRTARQRVADLRAERASLLRRLAAAGTPKIADHVRARLDVVTRRLNEARGRVRAVHARADLATLSLTVTAERRGAVVPPHHHPWTPGDALHDAGRVLEVAAGVVVVVLAVAAPFALFGALAWLAARTLGRRRRERLLDGA